jgi:hypothetical protein
MDSLFQSQANFLEGNGVDDAVLYAFLWIYF